MFLSNGALTKAALLLAIKHDSLASVEKAANLTDDMVTKTWFVFTKVWQSALMKVDRCSIRCALAHHLLLPVS